MGTKGPVSNLSGPWALPHAVILQQSGAIMTVWCNLVRLRPQYPLISLTLAPRIRIGPRL
jgi:hypothetical protein